MFSYSLFGIQYVQYDKQLYKFIHIYVTARKLADGLFIFILLMLYSTSAEGL